MNSLFKYPLDITGLSVENKVVGELHPEANADNPVIGTHYGAYFSESAVVYDAETGRVLNSPDDYRLVQPIPKANKLTGKDINSYILLSNTVILNEGIRIDYQALGGEYCQNVELVIETIDRLKSEKYQFKWDEVVKPDVFKPEYHKHHSDDIYGMEPIETVLKQLRDVLKEYVNKEITIDDVTNLRPTLDDMTLALNSLKDLTSEHSADLLRVWENIEALKRATSDHAIMLQTHLERLDAHEARLDTHDQTLSNHSGRIVSLEKEIPPIKSRLNTLEEGQENLNNITGDHERRLSIAEDEIDAIEIKNSEQDSRLQAIEEQDDNQEIRLAEQERLMADVRPRLESNEQKDIEQDGRLDGLGSRVSALEDSLGSTNDAAAALERRVKSNEDNIKDITVVNASQSETLALHTEELDRQKQEDIKMTTRIQESEKDITAIQQKDVEQDARLDALDVKTDATNVRVDSAESRLDATELETSANAAAIAALENLSGGMIDSTVVAVSGQTLVPRTTYLVDARDAEVPFVLTFSAVMARDGDTINIRTHSGSRTVEIRGSIFNCEDNLLVIKELNGWVTLKWVKSISKWAVVAGG